MSIGASSRSGCCVSGRLALVCDECDATWLDPDAVTEEHVRYPTPYPPVSVPSRHDSLRARAMACVRLIVPGRNRTAFVLPDGDALVRPATAGGDPWRRLG